ncbi:putative DNA helicase chromatin remodeling SNF2 family [Rosa chinensis]|uniref:Putative DNA helicase chromatin remodeling SNF2 family n=1 Tax=Rosa chinensis TaxID=74649 RepID=A0A2P6QQJ8_ROSCH|nr:DNA repair protein RAD5B [Rosa chinensis]PRQ36459.1 putative DNA helicase chromatin remodeling SNF2 family [Rosa chinensis]
MDSKEDEIPMGIPLMPMPMLVKRRNTSTGARISTVIKQEWPDEESDKREKLPVSKILSSSSIDEVPDTQEEPVPIKIKEECSEEIDQAEGSMRLSEAEAMSVVPDSLGDLAQQEAENVSIQVQRVGSEDVDEPVLIQVKREGSEEVEEAETMSEVPDSLAEQEAEPVSIEAKKEGSDEMDEAERLQESKPERLEQNEVPVLNVEPISTFIKLEDHEEYEAEKLFVLKPKGVVKKEAEDGREGLIKQEENVKKIRSVLGCEMPEFEILRALSECGGDQNAAVNFILENAGAIVVKKADGDVDSSKPKSLVKKEVPDCEVISVKQVRPPNLEDGDFPTERDWLAVGGTVVTALSTSKGRKLVDNEIVNLSFPSVNSSNKTRWIVRFSTKRSGEIGRFSMEWAKCVVPLVQSGKVKVRGRCIAAPQVLSMMQEIMLYISFYIHHSIFTEVDKSSWKLDASPNIDSTIYPLLTLFKLLKVQPYQKAEFTPEELDSRKRLLNIERIPNEAPLALPAPKRRKGSQQNPEENKDEQAISESSLNKIVGAAEVYDLEEMEPPGTLRCVLKPYQKQALHWMSGLEKGIDVEKARQTLHPCWAGYRICDERASSIYVNIFTGEATTKFPTATLMARGGILADAMGLGKTVMTIALILARPGRRGSNDIEITKKRKIDSDTTAPLKPKGGTLVVCPLSLLSQWKDELETHSEPESISIFVHYGGHRTTSPKAISVHDVVLTTYGVLAAAYKSDGEDSLFHQVDWYRVVLDEAHTIKSSRTQGAQAVFTLSSHCRWCLTGTPIQNNLEDLYSLLCFLHVEPWCNWAWWNKLIQRPYEIGDPRGLRLIKAILRPLMLRRTKETKDKVGRPILVLPPTDIQTIECEQSDAEHDFYNALFRRSKVQFDQFVAEGKVLHNYANILELLLRLRQCCNHPYLVMSRSDSQKKSSRGDSQKYADLDKLARIFLEASQDASTSKQSVPSRAYVEEVVEGIRKGENRECPICLEFADDPILTPCAHKMCRECLLSSWGRPTRGPCPICRRLIEKPDLISCPSESRFQVDFVEDWKESSKVAKLLDCLDHILQSGSGEKSIIFSQWTAFLDLLEIPMKRRGIEFLRFDGKLTQPQRERVLNEFNETRVKRVLLTSLKTGGVGLNLTAASNVFIMDPWWNPAVEEQAIMRIHRIGQKRTVTVRRFIVKDTVEERLLQVQARKQRMIAGALTDEEVRSARIEELKMLFT